MSREDNAINKLITTHQRRLQILKEQQATLGLHTPPHILIEIEDIETEIKDLQTKLRAFKRGDDEKPQNASPRLAKDTTASPIASNVQGKSQSATIVMPDYYTYRIRVGNKKQVQVEKRNPQHELLQEPQGAFRYKGALRKRVDELYQISQTGQLSPAQIKEFGSALFNLLFDDGLRPNFVEFYNEVIHTKKQFLRIELDIDEAQLPEVAALPWELMRVPPEAKLGIIWLGEAPNLVFSRRRSQHLVPPPIQLAPQEKLRIALAVSAPAGLGPVKYEKVQLALEKLAEKEGDLIEFLPIVTNANPDKINDILAKRPHIFHFIGHGHLTEDNGKPIGKIALTDDFFDEPEAMWVDEEFFSNLFSLHRPALVLLQACESGQTATSQAFVGVASRLVQQTIPVVVAMQYKVSNETASRFALSFYRELARDQPVDVAAQHGRHSIALNTQFNSLDFAIPVIFMRVHNGYLFSRSATSA